MAWRSTTPATMWTRIKECLVDYFAGGLPGDVAFVHVLTRRDRSRDIANGRDLALSDGTKLFLGSPGTGAPFLLPSPVQGQYR